MHKYLFLFALLSSIQTLEIYGAQDDLWATPEQLYVNLRDALDDNNLREINTLFNASDDLRKLTTPLHLITQANNKELVEQALKAGTNVNALDWQGRPALAYALSPDIARLLLNAGADPLIRFIITDKGIIKEIPIAEYISTIDQPGVEQAYRNTGMCINNGFVVIDQGTQITGNVLDRFNSVITRLQNSNSLHPEERSFVDNLVNTKNEIDDYIKNKSRNRRKTHRKRR